MAMTREEIMERIARCQQSVQECREYMADFTHPLSERQWANHGEVDNLVEIMCYEEDLAAMGTE